MITEHTLELHNYGEKGIGIRTKKHIKKGSIIMIEEPFFVLPIKKDGRDPDIDDTIFAFLNTSAENKELFESLKPIKNQNLKQPEHWQSILDNNAITLSFYVEGCRNVGLFEWLCRSNHSCTPNAVWNWRKSENKMYLHAYTTIYPNNEITVSYLNQVDLLLPHSERQDLLKNRFKCICTSCIASPKKIERSDKNLKKILEVWEKWFEIEDVEEEIEDPQLAIKELEKAIKLLDIENKVYSKGLILQCLVNCHHINKNSNDKQYYNAVNNVIKHYENFTGKWALEGTVYLDIHKDLLLSMNKS